MTLKSINNERFSNSTSTSNNDGNCNNHTGTYT